MNCTCVVLSFTVSGKWVAMATRLFCYMYIKGIKAGLGTIQLLEQFMCI